MKQAPTLPTVTTIGPSAVEISSFNAYPASRPTLDASNVGFDPSHHPSSRPSSRHGIRIRPGTPNSHGTTFSSHPMSPTRSSFVGTVHDPDSFIPPLSTVAKLGLWWNKFTSFWISTTFLVLVVGYATVHRILITLPNWFKRSTGQSHIDAWNDNSDHWKKEKVVKDPGYYARHCGYDLVDEEVETQDGYFLR